MFILILVALLVVVAGTVAYRRSLAKALPAREAAAAALLERTL
jgi:hypothetical protein